LRTRFGQRRRMRQTNVHHPKSTPVDNGPQKNTLSSQLNKILNTNVSDSIVLLSCLPNILRIYWNKTGSPSV
jgi:hypothetical protein